MTNQEKVLGVIRFAFGGTSLWDEKEYLIYPTNARVIFVKIGDPGTSDLSSIIGEIIIEKLSSESPDKILSSRRSNFAISYNDLDSLGITKGFIRTAIIFYWKGQRYKFKVPNNQYHTVRRWEEIYERYKMLQICPDCGNELIDPSKYCRTCDKNIYAFASDLRAAYEHEMKIKALKSNKQAGLIIIFTGFIMIFMITSTLYPTFGGNPLVFGLICLPIPILYITIGVFVFFGKRSGKLLFGILCLLFGVLCFMAAVRALLGIGGNGKGALIAVALGSPIFLYGYYLIRNLRRRKKP